MDTHETRLRLGFGNTRNTPDNDMWKPTNSPGITLRKPTWDWDKET